MLGMAKSPSRLSCLKRRGAKPVKRPLTRRSSGSRSTVIDHWQNSNGHVTSLSQLNCRRSGTTRSTVRLCGGLPRSRGNETHPENKRFAVYCLLYCRDSVARLLLQEDGGMGQSLLL